VFSTAGIAQVTMINHLYALVTRKAAGT